MNRSYRSRSHELRFEGESCDFASAGLSTGRIGSGHVANCPVGLLLLVKMSQAKKKEVDITWQHCESIPPNRLQVKCKYSHACWGGIARIKHHLARTKINVSACTSVLDDVKEMFVKPFESKDKKKENSLDCLEEVAKGKE
ncbi:hypothetical protein CR513_25551, partial [Mucuna pruriens]